MNRTAYILIFIICTGLCLPVSLFAQIPAKVFEITNILVDGCDGGNEGKNEMVLFQIGPNPVNVTDLRVDGAGSTGVFVSNHWPNTANPWRGIAAPPAKPVEVAAINSTITNCGRLIEPAGGILPAGKKVLMITSTDFNPTAHNFSTLGDTLYVIFQIAGNTSGHFANYGTPSSFRTLRLVHVPSQDSDTVKYDKSLLVNQQGLPGGQDGASVKYTFSGIATYYNPGCQAPYTPLSAAWINPGVVCQSASPIDLNTLITGVTGGSWAGTNVTGHIFNPAGLLGNIDISYTAGYAPCTTSDTQTIQVVTMASAAWTSPVAMCESALPVDLNALITGNTGGTWSGTGVTDTIFNPAGLNGNISVSYVVGSPPCKDSVTHVIQVIPGANASWTNPGVVCQSASPIDLTTLITGTPGGNWTGTGVSGNIFNPFGLNGNINVTYSAGTAPCAASITHTIQVVSTADASWTNPAIICQSSSPLNLNTLVNGNTGGTWSGTGITDSIFDPAGLIGNINITYSVGTSPCNASVTHIIQVDSNANASWASPGVACPSDPPVNLSAYITGDPGGTWSGPGITNTATGLFDPAVAGIGIHQISYYFSGTCGDSVSSTITVTSLADATITNPGPFCSNGSPVILSAATPGGTWSGTGITNTATGQFSPLIAGAGSWVITYTIGGNCGNTGTTTITVFQTANASITPQGPLCETAAPLNLTAVNPGGTWNGTGITNTTLGTFDPGVSGAGSFIISFIKTGLCPDTGYITITVDAAVDGSIDPVGPFCTNDALVTLTAADQGGTWSGTGITSATLGTFDPAIGGPGNHLITYIINSGVCTDTGTTNITVNAAVDATIDTAGPFCQGDAAVTLTAADAGGTWSGAGITSGTLGTFDPAIAGAGAHTITYIINAGVCSDTGNTIITVNNATDATINSPGPLCTADAVVTLTAANPGGTWSGPGITSAPNGTFDPVVAGVGTHTVVYYIAGICGNSDTAHIKVRLSPSVRVTGTGEHCNGASDGIAKVIPLNGSTSYSYHWSNLQTDTVISSLSPGAYSVTVTDTNGCSVIKAAEISVSAEPCEVIVPVIYVPNVFTPNGDGKNDFLFVRGRGIKTLNFYIYDRWGEKVFETSDPGLNEGWNGNFNNKPMDAAVYVYHLSAEFIDGTSKKFQGNITLTR